MRYISYDHPTDFRSVRFRARHRRRPREPWRPRGTTDPRPSCKTSGRHLFWRLQDSRRVPLVSRAQQERTEHDRRAADHADHGASHHSYRWLTHHSLTIHWHARGSDDVPIRTRARRRRKRALPTSRNSLDCFSIRPRPGRCCFLSVAGP